jgi:hypothetical protein
VEIQLVGESQLGNSGCNIAFIRMKIKRCSPVEVIETKERTDEDE